jgi:uncharacterized protein (DUF488 family)
MSSKEPNAPGLEPGASRSESFVLYTIGYGARSVDDLVAILRSLGIEYLVDVRTSPYSKFKPEFNQDLLRYEVERQGLKYLFLGDTLGGQPKDPACLSDGKVDYDKVRAQPLFQAGLERLKKAHAQRLRLALMCSEGRPEQCHRTKLIGEALVAIGIPVGHIDEDGKVLTQQQVIDRLTQGQLDLFGSPSFTSRKRYGKDDHLPPS